MAKTVSAPLDFTASGWPKDCEQKWHVSTSGPRQLKDAVSIPPLLKGDMFQDPQWMLETSETTKHCVHYIHSYRASP